MKHWLNRCDDLRNSSLKFNSWKKLKLSTWITIISIMRKMIFWFKKGFMLPFAWKFYYRIIFVFIEFERKVNTADHCLRIWKILANIWIYQIISLEESRCIENNFLVFERILILFFSFPHKMDKTFQIALSEDVISTYWILKLSIMLNFLFLKGFYLFLIQYPLRLWLHYLILNWWMIILIFWLIEKIRAKMDKKKGKSRSKPTK